ncbi:MAG TPA: hypothetical protein VD838_13595 [Anaeromyxobacteraceae bacterium]|nr:hypothetical protein [Anaeromyxobacteraceae bacterium]
MTRRNLIPLVLALGCTHATPAAPASPPSEAAQPATQARQLPTPDEVVARLADALALTDAQKKAITPIVAARQERLAALAADDGVGRRRKARAAKAILEDADRQIEPILTHEQRERYAALKEELREHARERMRQKRAGAR